METFFHIPVMLHACIDSLAIRPDGVYVDATLGGGGHSGEILRRLSSAGRLIGIDRDEEALSAASARLAPFGSRFAPVKSDFRRIREILQGLSISAIDGILFDFGVSSPQLDDGSRGFSYSKEAPLDMRMDKAQALTARDIVNGWDKEQLKKIFYEYGEERYAGLIASAIAKRREERPFETTLELSDLIKSVLPAKARREEQHPAKRVFQSLRIAVNDELAAIAEAVPDSVDMLKKGGRLAAVTFHSLEDRIVKTALAGLAKGCVCPPDFPVCVCGKVPAVKLITKKPITADGAELTENPRARSAKLRVAEKL